MVYSEMIAVGFVKDGWNIDFNSYLKMTAIKILYSYTWIF